MNFVQLLNGFVRFDVSGVHPQSKMPGTFTQTPYDKKATSDHVSSVSRCLLTKLAYIFVHFVL